MTLSWDDNAIKLI